jgi:hypothetical protein
MNKLVVCSTLVLATGAAVAQPTGAPVPAQPPGPAPAMPYYAPPPVRDGLTFEANLGFGIFRVSNDSGDSDSENGLGGLNLGIGTFVNPNMAISLRAAGVTYSDDGGSITQAFFGPSVQYFVSPNAFVGGGVGLGVARIEIDGLGSDSETGFAVDLRAGYSFNPGAKHSFNASVEITPAFIEDVTFTGIAFLAGYQLQ